MGKKNPILNIKILDEVLIELRYTSKKDYNILFSALYEGLKKKYNKFENLNIPDFPNPPPDFPKTVNFRIKSKDDKKLYQIGNGIFSINNLNYNGYDSFLGDVSEILEIHKNMSDFQYLDYLSLRYINKIEIDRNINDIFEVDLKIPKSLKDKELGFSYFVNCKYDKDYLKISFYTAPFSKDYVKFDLSYYVKEKFTYDLVSIKEWIEVAHDNIYNAFTDCIKKDYYNYLLKGKNNV
jgi:uncharacterized protein (TIGR04255 family)